MPCFGCIVEHLALLFILICFMEIGNLDLPDLLCVALIFIYVYKKKHDH